MPTKKSELEELTGLRRINKKILLDLCKKNGLYQTPHLNDVLYLHYQGFRDIEGLEEYTGLKCLWLESNAISEIGGLDNQSILKCLFLHNNLIRKIENLHYCRELDTMNLAHNHIANIENCGIDVLPVLTNLNLANNYIRTYDALKGLIDCKMLSVLDLGNNRIDDVLVVKIFSQMPELRVLILQGNPVVGQIPQYRKTLILECKNLTYLDSRPVFPKDRACAEAWKRGGYEEERAEHDRWIKEENRKMRDNVNSLIRLKNYHKKDGEKKIKLLTSDEENIETNSDTDSDTTESGSNSDNNRVEKVFKPKTTTETEVELSEYGYVDDSTKEEKADINKEDGATKEIKNSNENELDGMDEENEKINKEIKKENHTKEKRKTKRQSKEGKVKIRKSKNKGSWPRKYLLIEEPEEILATAVIHHEVLDLDLDVNPYLMLSEENKNKKTEVYKQAYNAYMSYVSTLGESSKSTADLDNNSETNEACGGFSIQANKDYSLGSSECEDSDDEIKKEDQLEELKNDNDKTYESQQTLQNQPISLSEEQQERVIEENLTNFKITENIKALRSQIKTSVEIVKNMDKSDELCENLKLDDNVPNIQKYKITKLFSQNTFGSSDNEESDIIPDESEVLSPNLQRITAQIELLKKIRESKGERHDFDQLYGHIWSKPIGKTFEEMQMDIIANKCESETSNENKTSKECMIDKINQEENEEQTKFRTRLVEIRCLLQKKIDFDESVNTNAEEKRNKVDQNTNHNMVEIHEKDKEEKEINSTIENSNESIDTEIQEENNQTEEIIDEGNSNTLKKENSIDEENETINKQNINNENLCCIVENERLERIAEEQQSEFSIYDSESIEDKLQIAINKNIQVNDLAEIKQLETWDNKNISEHAQNSSKEENNHTEEIKVKDNSNILKKENHSIDEENETINKQNVHNENLCCIVENERLERIAEEQQSEFSIYDSESIEDKLQTAINKNIQFNDLAEIKQSETWDNKNVSENAENSSEEEFASAETDSYENEPFVSCEYKFDSLEQDKTEELTLETITQRNDDAAHTQKIPPDDIENLYSIKSNDNTDDNFYSKIERIEEELTANPLNQSTMEITFEKLEKQLITTSDLEAISEGIEEEQNITNTLNKISEEVTSEKLEKDLITTNPRNNSFKYIREINHSEQTRSYLMGKEISSNFHNQKDYLDVCKTVPLQTENLMNISFNIPTIQNEQTDKFDALNDGTKSTSHNDSDEGLLTVLSKFENLTEDLKDEGNKFSENSDYTTSHKSTSTSASSHTSLSKQDTETACKTQTKQIPTTSCKKIYFSKFHINKVEDSDDSNFSESSESFSDLEDELETMNEVDKKAFDEYCKMFKNRDKHVPRNQNLINLQEKMTLMQRILNENVSREMVETSKEIFDDYTKDEPSDCRDSTKASCSLTKLSHNEITFSKESSLICNDDFIQENIIDFSELNIQNEGIQNCSSNNERTVSKERSLSFNENYIEEKEDIGNGNPSETNILENFTDFTLSEIENFDGAIKTKQNFEETICCEETKTFSKTIHDIKSLDATTQQTIDDCPSIEISIDPTIDSSSEMLIDPTIGTNLENTAISTKIISVDSGYNEILSTEGNTTEIPDSQ